MGRKFTVETDRKALLPIFNKNCIEKQYSSRLIRWRQRLLPYNFEVIYRPGRTMGLTDILSRSPHGNSPPDKPLEEESFVIAKIGALNDIKNEVLSDQLLAYAYKQRRKIHRNNKANTAEDLHFTHNGHNCFELPADAIRHVKCAFDLSARNGKWITTKPTAIQKDEIGQQVNRLKSL